MNKRSDLIFIITHLKKRSVTDAFCSVFPLPPALGIPACASERDMLGLAVANSNPQTSGCASLELQTCCLQMTGFQSKGSHHFKG